MNSPSSGLTYAIPIGAVLSFWTGFVLSTVLIAACAAYALILGARVQAAVLVVTWAGLFFGVVVPSLLMTRRVEVNANTLTAVTTLGFRKSVAWREIVKTRESPANRIWRSYAVLELIDRAGRVRVQLNSRLAGYERLAAQVQRHVHATRMGASSLPQPR